MRSAKLKTQNALRSAGWLRAELFIVIIGVYVAFLLNEWRASHAETEARRQLYSALQEELRDVDANIEELQAYDIGKQPC